MQHDGRSTGDEVTALVRAWIKERRAGGMSFDKIAEMLGITKAYVINLNEGSRGAGGKTERNFAERFYNGSIDALRDAARKAWQEQEAMADALPPELERAIKAVSEGEAVHEDDLAAAREAAAACPTLSFGTWVALLTDLARHRREKSPSKRPKGS